MNTTKPIQVVALNSRNDVAAVVREFADYPGALGYLIHNLPRRRNLDLRNATTGKFIAWEETIPEI